MKHSVDWLLISLLFVSAVLHAGLFAALNDWQHPPRPTLAMPVIQIGPSASSSQDSTAAPGHTGKTPSVENENAALAQHRKHFPSKTPKPPSLLPSSGRIRRHKIPLPVIRTITAPPPLHLAAAPSPAPPPQPKPAPTPRPAQHPSGTIREPQPPAQSSPGAATRSLSQPVPAPQTTSRPQTKAASREPTKPGPGESAGSASAAANRDADAHATGHGPPGPELNRYLHRIVQRIEAKKHYPLPARTRRIEGRTTVFFRISTQGGLLASRIVHHSGHDILDRAAIKAVNDAAPFPKPPQRFRGKPIALQVVLVFSLDSADRR
jgi:protein TonB